MIAAANRDIRRQWTVRERRRQDVTVAAFGYLDELLDRLELMHLQGRRFVPARFIPRLLAVNALLPCGVRPLTRSRTLIRHAIDDCFELQESLQAFRVRAAAE